jgi:hypothetical protein
MKALKETERSSKIQIVTKKIVEEKKDWWEELSDEAKVGIYAGLEDIRNGRVVSYDEVKRKFGWK